VDGSQVTLSVAKRPFGDDFVPDTGDGGGVSGGPTSLYGEVPWQLQQLHLYTGSGDPTHISEMTQFDPRLQPVPTWTTTDMNTRPLPSPPGGRHLSVYCFDGFETGRARGMYKSPPLITKGSVSI